MTNVFFRLLALQLTRSRSSPWRCSATRTTASSAATAKPTPRRSNIRHNSLTWDHGPDQSRGRRTLPPTRRVTRTRPSTRFPCRWVGEACSTARSGSSTAPTTCPDRSVRFGLCQISLNHSVKSPKTLNFWDWGNFNWIYLIFQNSHHW